MRTGFTGPSFLRHTVPDSPARFHEDRKCRRIAISSQGISHRQSVIRGRESEFPPTDSHQQSAISHRDSEISQKVEELFMNWVINKENEKNLTFFEAMRLK